MTTVTRTALIAASRDEVWANATTGSVVEAATAEVLQQSFSNLLTHLRGVLAGSYAGIDIFRLDDDGKVIEHWDVLQVIPDESRNDNGMF